MQDIGTEPKQTISPNKQQFLPPVKTLATIDQFS